MPLPLAVHNNSLRSTSRAHGFPPGATDFVQHGPLAAIRMAFICASRVGLGPIFSECFQRSRQCMTQTDQMDQLRSIQTTMQTGSISHLYDNKNIPVLRHTHRNVYSKSERMPVQMPGHMSPHMRECSSMPRLMSTPTMTCIFDTNVCPLVYAGLIKHYAGERMYILNCQSWFKRIQR